jgi:hypothetical protein
MSLQNLINLARSRSSETGVVNFLRMVPRLSKISVVHPLFAQQICLDCFVYVSTPIDSVIKDFLILWSKTSWFCDQRLLVFSPTPDIIADPKTQRCFMIATMPHFDFVVLLLVQCHQQTKQSKQWFKWIWRRSFAIGNGTLLPEL